MTDKKSFVLSNDNIEDFMELTDEQAGQLIKAIFAHENEVDYEISDPVVSAVFRPIRRKLDANREAYEEKVEKRREAGARGGRPRKLTEAEVSAAEEENQTKAKKANGFSEKQSKAKKAVTDTVTDTDTDTDNNKIKDLCANAEQKTGSDEEKEKERMRLYGSFEVFWNAYPNKKSKKSALERWMKIRPDDELRAKIMRALEAQKNSSDWKRDGGQYIPHPSTWLNQERWNDEVRPDTGTKGKMIINTGQTRELSFLER